MDIPIEEILTQREHWVYLGSTPSGIDVNTLDPKDSKWDIPHGLLNRSYGVSQIREARRKLGFRTSIILSLYMELKGRLGFTLEDISNDGITVRDPKIVGVDLDGSIIDHATPEQYERFRNGFKERGMPFPDSRAEPKQVKGGIELGG